MNVQDLCTAIRLIPHVDFDERAGQDLIEAIKDRLEVSNFKHMEHATQAVESLEDAACILWNAADDIAAFKEAA
jgi:polyhydroxyalkanoate synthesis regulator phasin